MKKVQLTCLDTQTIVEGHWYTARHLQSSDGRIIFTYENVKENKKDVYSADGGKTWQEIDDVMGRFNFTLLSDGSVIGFSMRNEIEEKIPQNQYKKPYILGVRRAASFDELLRGNFEDDFVRADIPDLGVGNGDHGIGFCGVCDHGIVELPSGEILVTMYGFFHEDRTPMTVIKAMNYQYRSWVIVSRDGAKSFEYLSTIADVQTYSELKLAEGFCEPEIKLLDDGSLLCLMRTGGQRRKEFFTPMYSSKSNDGGKSWSAPNYVYDFGVFPRITQTQNGAVIVASGREGVFLSASADRGESWQEPLFVSENFASVRGHFWRCSTGYNCIMEVAPNEILLIYDDIDDTKEYPIPDPTTNVMTSIETFESCHKVIAKRYKVELV